MFATQGREYKVVDAFARFWARTAAPGGTRRHPCVRACVPEVSCDMSPAFTKGIGESLPDAEVTFGRFHVARVLGDAVDPILSEQSRHKNIK